MPAESNANTIADDICVGLFTTDAVAGLLHVTPKRVKAWRTAGLIEPTVVRGSVEYYDFAQLSAARSLCELVRSGLKPARLRQVLASVRALVADGLATQYGTHYRTCADLDEGRDRAAAVPV